MLRILSWRKRGGMNLPGLKEVNSIYNVIVQVVEYEEIDWNSAASGGRIRKRKFMYVVKMIVAARREKNAI